jgi:thiamine biosynthesis lipoprotein
MTATAAWRAWSCTVRVTVDRDDAIDAASAGLAELMNRVELACSRFRDDSEISRANARAGLPTPLSPLASELVGTALRAAADSHGAVDPTVGHHLVAAGYDTDIEFVRRSPGERLRVDRLPQWRAVGLDPDLRVLTVPVGLSLDLGSTAKAWTVDRAADDIARRHGCGVLVEIGGDLATAGGAQPWLIRVAEREGGGGELVTLSSGGITTSTTTVRRWHRDGEVMHHIIDPRTGACGDGPWRTASVWADTAVDANTASTAALVLGHRALDWLTARGTTARLVGTDGHVLKVGGWPADTVAA